MKKALTRILSLVLLAAVCGCCAAAETQETMDRVLDIALPYYTAAVEVAKMSPGYGRNFTDHKTAHAEMVPVKAREAGIALEEAARLGTLPTGAGARPRCIQYGDRLSDAGRRGTVP